MSETIDAKVAKWLKENPNDEISSLLDKYNAAWFGFFSAAPQTHSVKQVLGAYARLKKAFHNATDTPYF